LIGPAVQLAISYLPIFEDQCYSIGRSLDLSLKELMNTQVGSITAVRVTRTQEHLLTFSIGQQRQIRQVSVGIFYDSLEQGVEVGHAIASRMTVVDHAPESEVAHDYVQLAGWLQKVAPVRRAATASGRWTEQ